MGQQNLKNIQKRPRQTSGKQTQLTSHTGIFSLACPCQFCLKPPLPDKNITLFHFFLLHLTASIIKIRQSRIVFLK